MRKDVFAIVAFALAGLGCMSATAFDTTPLQLSLTPDAQVVPDDWSVAGLRLCLPYGRNESVYGLDLGAITQFDDEFLGFQVALANVAGPGHDPRVDSFNGLQVGGLINYFRGHDFYGMQIAGLANISRVAERQVGIQIAGIGNWNRFSSFTGLQISGILGNGGTWWGGGAGSEGGGGMVPDDDEPAGDVTGVQISLSGIGAAAYVPYTPIGVIVLALPVNRAGEMRGLQLAGIGINESKTWLRGVQIAGLVNLCRDGTGAQLGLANCCLGRHGSDFTGLQLGGLNLAGVASAEARFGVATGVQVGGINYARRLTGIQIGAINYANALNGVQIGAVNIIRSGPVPFLPIVNAAF